MNNMSIKQITIKNVRGLENHTIELNMIPNKPSILVAPNGSGKSSFALAFKSLKKNGLKVDEDELFNNKSTNIPSLVIETSEDKVYSATLGKNDISKIFDCYVINNQNKPKSSILNINGVRIARTKMVVNPIILVNKIPSDTNLINTFITDYHLEKLVKGSIPSIGDLLKNFDYLNQFVVDDLKNISRQLHEINKFLKKLETYTGRKKDIWDRIENEDLTALKNIMILSSRIELIKRFYTHDTDVLLYLKAIQIIILFLKDEGAFKRKIKFAEYTIEKNAYFELFSSLMVTWKEIRPKEIDGKLLVEISDTNKLSNGERDIIVFIAMLQKAKKHLLKKNNFLIIDEIFDYLDDANLIAAQYYISQFINDFNKQNKNIYPIILTHLNPGYFKGYAFNKLKVYYLKQHKIPNYTEKMMKLLTKREKLEENDLISKFMLHFYNNYDNVDLSKILIEKDLQAWRNISVFKTYCMKETEKYIGHDGDEFDVIAICIWLRECIEKYLYERLPQENQESFFDKEQNGTSNKLKYAEQHGVNYPEIFSLLGLIHNEVLHTKKEEMTELQQILCSRLNNNTIKRMIEKVLKICNSNSVSFSEIDIKSSEHVSEQQCLFSEVTDEL